MTSPGAEQETWPGAYRAYRDRRERPPILCCESRWLPWPSGHAWTHSLHCIAGPRIRGQKVEMPRDLRWLDLPWSGSAADTWRSHPADHQCAACLYVEAHLDDDDDDGRPWADHQTEGATDDRGEG